MLGRLSHPRDNRIQAFPVDSWREEFARAREAGIDCLEWIYDEETAPANPLSVDEGIAEIRDLQEAWNVPVSSICADYFMTRRLVRHDGRVDRTAAAHLIWLLSRASRAGARHVVLPFVDASSLRTAEEVDGALAVLRDAVPAAAQCAVELHLETDLAPTVFVGLLERLDHPAVRVTYDIGNSAALGYSPREELANIGPWLGSVHVKDRMLAGGTVPLGTGAADFSTAFSLIRRAGFRGPFILQTARDPAISEVELARRNRRFVAWQVAGTLPAGGPDGGVGTGR